MSRSFRWFLILLGLGLLVGGVSVWAQHRLQTWIKLARVKVDEELAKENLSIDFQKVDFDPWRGGLVAQQVKLYEGVKKNRLLVSTDELKISVDVHKLIQGQSSLEDIKLKGAVFSVPTGPEGSVAHPLQVKDVNAEVRLSGQRIEVRRAIGRFHGFNLSFDGQFLRPSARVKKKRLLHEREIAENPLVWVRENYLVMDRLLRELEAFEHRAQDALLKVDFEGDLDRPQELKVKARLTASNLGYRGYGFQKLEADMEYSQGEFTCPRVQWSDEVGSCFGGASWVWGKDKIDFSIDSTADLLQLVQAIMPQSWPVKFKAVDPIILQAKGSYRLASSPTQRGQLKCTGAIKTGRCTLSEVDFKKLESDFHLEGKDFYLRGLTVGHESGELSGQVMRRGQKWQYDLRSNLNPLLLLPLIPSQVPAIYRREIEHWSMSPSGEANITAKGEGTIPTPGQKAAFTLNFSLTGKGISYMDVLARELDAEVLVTPQATTISKARVLRPEGEVWVPLLDIHYESKSVTIRDLKGTLHPVPIVQLFAPTVAQEISAYSFTTPVPLTFDGVIPWADISKLQFDIFFQPIGAATYKIEQTPLRIESPQGRIAVRGEEISVELQGQLASRTRFSGLYTTNPGALNFTGRFPLKRGMSQKSRWNAKLNVPGLTEAKIGAVTLPLNSLMLDLEGLDDRLNIKNMTANLFAGPVVGSGQVDKISSDRSFSAAVQFDRIFFKDFAQLYSPNMETEGLLSGGIYIFGQGDDFQKVRGTGRCRVQDGNIFAIPFLGPLSPLLSAVLPGEQTAYGKAREASLSFSIEKGVAEIKDFKALTQAFVIDGNGTLNFNQDKVDLKAYVNLRGPTGVLLLPVSKLLQYVAEGTLKDPKWRPLVVALPMKLIPDELLNIPRQLLPKITPDLRKKAPTEKAPPTPPAGAAPNNRQR